MSLQTAYNDGSTIAEVVKQEPVTITQASTAASNYLLRVNNSGAGRSLQIDNSGAAYALVLRQFGAGNCVAIGQKSTSIHNVLELENSGSGKTVQVLHSTGSGNVIDITNSGSGAALYIDHKHTGDTAVIQITNSGSGADIVGNGASWNVDPAGRATFASVDVGCGLVYSKNTAVAGGRLHAYQPSVEEEVQIDMWCEWGLAISYYTRAGSLQGVGTIIAMFDEAVYCPIIKITPWLAGQYDETQGGNFNYIAEGHTNMPLSPLTALEPHIVQVIPINPIDPDSPIIGFEVYFQYCEAGNPAVQDAYEVAYDAEIRHDLVFDFEVLGCLADIEPPV